MTQLPLLLIIAIALGSLALTIFSLLRVHSYIQAYRFEEVQYKPLFGLIHLHFVLALYLIGTLLIAGFSISLIL